MIEQIAPIRRTPAFAFCQPLLHKPLAALPQRLAHVGTKATSRQWHRCLCKQFLIEPGSRHRLGKRVNGYGRQQFDPCTSPVLIEFPTARRMIFWD